MLLGLVETANGDWVELDAQAWSVGQHAVSVFNNDRLFEDRVTERVVTDVIFDQRRLHDVPAVRIIGERCDEMAVRC